MATLIKDNTSEALRSTEGYGLVIAAACLWSLSGLFSKTIGLSGPVMATYRALFAAAVLALLLRGRKRPVQPAIFSMMLCFVVMNASFVTAMTLTTAANAIFLQYSAPLFVFIGSVFWLKEPVTRAGLISLAIGMAGVAIIVAGDLAADPLGISLALLSGVAYAGVFLHLRFLKEEDPYWLTFYNHLAAGLVLIPFLPLISGPSLPWQIPWTGMAAMALFGIVQMGLPYVLFAKGVQKVTAQKATLIALLEPLLNPLLVFMALGETPSQWTLAGGALLFFCVVRQFASPRPKPLRRPQPL